ncbi:hypothetical protein TGFOU_313273 [Toxoplasma gondii FOU]|uniref:Uncharacterized protein n=1 Tax=Toxoplasma gondii FOU TaxID=943167 RepID=A0A086LHI4_TOXGO|nr:hypothetical protein TGFOU_313273 [Toxoplasma gondii FOU]
MRRDRRTSEECTGRTTRTEVPTLCAAIRTKQTNRGGRQGPPRVRCGEKRIKRRQSHSGEFAKQTGRVRVASATETNRGV